MTLYVYPPTGTTFVDIAPGADFATETTLALIETAVDGLETLVTSTNSKLDTLNSKDFATEATLAKLKKWPYATYAKIVPTSDVNNEYYTYKTSGDVTVGTITKAIATGIITYSPDKVV